MCFLCFAFTGIHSLIYTDNSPYLHTLLSCVYTVKTCTVLLCLYLAFEITMEIYISIEQNRNKIKFISSI